jgi:hypothetical protein
MHEIFFLSDILFRDRPFNLKGGVMVFCFVQNFFFERHELEYLFFLSREGQIFFPEFNIRLYDKNSESDFFFLHQKQNIFFSNVGNQNIFLEKNHNPPPFKLNGRSLTSCYFTSTCLVLEISLFGSIVVRHRSNVFHIWHSDPYMDRLTRVYVRCRGGQEIIFEY